MFWSSLKSSLRVSQATAWMDGILEIALRNELVLAASSLNVDRVSLLLRKSQSLEMFGTSSSDASGDESGDVISNPND